LYSPSRGSESLWQEYEQSLDQARTQRQKAWAGYRDSASRERQQLRQKYRLQRRVINGLPVSVRDRSQLLRQLALRQTIETRTLKRKLAIQRNAIQKTWHPGTWRHFVASLAAQRDARVIRLRKRREGERDRISEERDLRDAGRWSGAADRQSERGLRSAAGRHNQLVQRNLALDMSTIG
jgi:hypothetical protein